MIQVEIHIRKERVTFDADLPALPTVGNMIKIKCDVYTVRSIEFSLSKPVIKLGVALLGEE